MITVTLLRNRHDNISRPESPDSTPYSFSRWFAAASGTVSASVGSPRNRPTRHDAILAG